MEPLKAEQTRWFTEKVQPHEVALRSYLRGRFPKLKDIDDLVQETYARFFRGNRAQFIAEPRAYLFATARNAAVDAYRRHQNVSASDLVEMDLESVVEDVPNAAEIASHEQEVRILGDAIDALPPRCRDVLVLRRFHGLSYSDIAAKLGISEHTVNAQLAIALLRCRKHLRARGVLDRKHHASPSR